MKFAIPSYQREGKNRAINYLIKSGIKPENIYLFLHNKEQSGKYKEAGIPSGVNILLTEAKGISGQRNFIMNYMGLTRYIMMDDDISSIIGLGIAETGIEALISRGFSLCDSAENIALWGLNPGSNPFYMQKCKPIQFNKHFQGTFIAFNKYKTVIPEGAYEGSEDTYILLSALEKGRLLFRLNKYYVKQAHRTNGGCTEIRNLLGYKGEKETLMRMGVRFANLNLKEFGLRVLSNPHKLKNRSKS